MTPKALQQIYRLQTAAMFPALLKITYVEDGVTKYLRLVNNDTDLTYSEEVYSCARFKYTPPKYSDKQIGDGSITISAVDQTIVQIIRSISTRATAQIVAAFYFEDGTLLFEPIEEWTFQLAKVSWDEGVATWQMIYDDRMDILVPCHKMSAQRCPGVA